MKIKVLFLIYFLLNFAKSSPLHEEERDFYNPADEDMSVIPDLIIPPSSDNAQIDVDKESLNEPEFPSHDYYVIDVNEEQWSAKTKEYVFKCESGLLDGANTTLVADDCVTCTCDNADVACKKQKCPQPKCSDAVKVDGECCPQCPEKLCETRDGRRFKDGDEWHIDDCTYCECNKGNSLCSVEDCQMPNCPNPVRVPGKCCPVCPEGSCHASNSTFIASGDVWKEGQCTHCYCRGGERTCAEEKCPFVNCTDAFVRPGECCKRCPTAVDCVPSMWGVWGDCPNQECGGGMRRRYRGVVLAPSNGGSFCPHMSEAQGCPPLDCKILPVCPVTDWSDWSHCTATCGAGFRMRTRQKDKVTKVTMLIDCSRTHLQETAPCDAGSCAEAKIIGDYEYEIYDDICYDVIWSPWEPCSAECGVGEQTRRQMLRNENHPRGHFCKLLTERRKCHEKRCGETGVSCKVSSWSIWSPCTKSCGHNGQRSKHRSITRQPTNGGKPCPSLVVNRRCRNQPPCAKFDQLSALMQDQDCISADGRRTYAENEHWQPSPCETCVCIGGYADCSPIQCQKPTCANPIKQPGYCCEICLDDITGGKKTHNPVRL